MKSKLIILSAVVLMFSAGQVFAEGGHGHGEMADEKGSMMEHSEAAHSDAVKVGNRICPVSGEFIPEGEEVEYEYEGKVYNLCCKMCVKDFKKNPEKFSKIAKELMLKEHGEAHEKQETPHHSHSSSDEGHGGHQDEGRAHDCEGAGCTE